MPALLATLSHPPPSTSLNLALRSRPSSSPVQLVRRQAESTLSATYDHLATLYRPRFHLGLSNAPRFILPRPVQQRQSFFHPFVPSAPAFLFEPRQFLAIPHHLERPAERIPLDHCRSEHYFCARIEQQPHGQFERRGADFVKWGGHDVLQRPRHELVCCVRDDECSRGVDDERCSPQLQLVVSRRGYFIFSFRRPFLVEQSGSDLLLLFTCLFPFLLVLFAVYLSSSVEHLGSRTILLDSSEPASTSSSSSAPPPSSSDPVSTTTIATSPSPSATSDLSSFITSITSSSAAAPTSATAQPTSSSSSPDGGNSASTTSRANDDETTSRNTELHTMTQTSQYTLTTSGTVVVVTSVITAVITGDPSGSAGAGGRSLNGSSGSGNSFFNNTGAVAGTFVVVGLVAAGLVIGLAFFFLRRRRARRLDEDIRVAAGGAGDGGAGHDRFNDDDEDMEDDPFGRMSEGHGSNYMSSYGTVPLTAAAAGFGARPNSGYDFSNGSGGGATGAGPGSAGRPSFDPGHSPAHSSGSIPPFAAAYAPPSAGGVNGYNGYGTGMSGARSHEGVLNDNWEEYVNDVGAGYGAGAGAGIGAALLGGRGPSSGEGSMGEMGSGEHIGSANSHSGHDHSPNMRDSGESYHGAPSSGDLAGFRNSLYGSAYGLDAAGSAEGKSPPTPKTDDRLDPGALEHPNGSAASLADEQDYSRRILRVVN
ncbi:hypothetical protein JCM10213v2_004539 [Rhodosporidiobolus nylandii]